MVSWISAGGREAYVWDNLFLDLGRQGNDLEEQGEVYLLHVRHSLAWHKGLRTEVRSIAMLMVC